MTDPRPTSREESAARLESVAKDIAADLDADNRRMLLEAAQLIRESSPSESSRVDPEDVDTIRELRNLLDKQGHYLYRDSLDRTLDALEPASDPAPDRVAEGAADLKRAAERMVSEVVSAKQNYYVLPPSLVEAFHALAVALQGGTGVREDDEARVEMLDERIRRVFGIPHNLARVMSRDKLRPLLRPGPTTLKGEDK